RIRVGGEELEVEDRAIRGQQQHELVAIEGLLLGRTVADGGAWEHQRPRSVAAPVSHVDRGAIEQVAARRRYCGLLAKPAAELGQQSTEAAGAAVELALGEEP